MHKNDIQLALSHWSKIKKTRSSLAPKRRRELALHKLAALSPTGHCGALDALPGLAGRHAAREVAALAEELACLSRVKRCDGAKA